MKAHGILPSRFELVLAFFPFRSTPMLLDAYLADLLLPICCCRFAIFAIRRPLN